MGKGEKMTNLEDNKIFAPHSDNFGDQKEILFKSFRLPLKEREKRLFETVKCFLLALYLFPQCFEKLSPPRRLGKHAVVVEN